MEVLLGGRVDPLAQREYARAYYLANQERLKANARVRMAAYRLADPEKLRARSRAAAARRDKGERQRYMLEWYQKNPEYIRTRNIAAYGITQADYEAMLAEQGGVCAICLTDKPRGRGKRWYVDHDHKTGKVRGLLCHACNTMLGFGKDDPAHLRAGAAYLERRAVI